MTPETFHIIVDFPQRIHILRLTNPLFFGMLQRVMDIVPKLKFTHLKGSFITLKLKHKLFLMLFLLSLCLTLLPHKTYAYSIRGATTQALVFDMTNTEYIDHLSRLNNQLNLNYQRQELEKKAKKQLELTEKIQEYLEAEGSPLADYASSLVILSNWKKIVALSNAESGMCQVYPTSKANCWGVGGSNLWDMGNNLGDGITAMNKFLNTYPKNSKIKYAQMSFKQMNGLYKKPAAEHWVFNNQVVYDELTAIEKSIQ